MKCCCQGGFVKHFHIAFVTLLLLLFIGCSGNDRTGAGHNLGGNTGSSSAAASQDYNWSSGSQTDPDANGGSALRASTPYRQANAPAVSQNLNPAPFMSGNQIGQSPSSANIVETNRAMGTVEGPMDQPPASVGPGMQGMNPNSSFSSGPQGESGRAAQAGQTPPAASGSQGAANPK